MTLDELRHSKKQETLRIATGYGASNVRVFGSVARGESSPASDIDFMVDLAPDRTLMDLGGLLMDLRQLLDQPVDVVTAGMLRPKVLDQALRDAVPL